MNIRKLLVKKLLDWSVSLSGTIYHKSGITTDGSFRTYTGVKFNLIRPDESMINIDDIARGLSLKPHFSGHTPFFFSIANHSLMVESMVSKAYPDDYEVRLAALLHDGTESYLGDMIKPLKNLLPNFEVIEDNVERVIFSKYAIDPSLLKIVKHYDIISQDYESRVFREGVDVDGILEVYSMEEAERIFLERFYFLISKYKNR